MEPRSPLEEYIRLHKMYLYSDYSISDLAKHLSVSRRTIERWLAGKYYPSEDNVKKIKEYLTLKYSKSS